MASSSLLFLLLIEFAGAAVLQWSSLYEPEKQFTSHYTKKTNSLNDSNADQDAVTGAILAGTVLVSLYSSVFTEKGIEIDISNRMTTSLDEPTWYMLHGHAAILPPFLIKENEPSTVIQFEKVPSSAFGTEGVVSYRIGAKGTLSLVIMWKMPQVFSSTAFFVKIEKSGNIPAENLKSMFNDVDENKLWFHVDNQHHWQTKKEEGLTWKAAMGTRYLSTLKVIITK